MTERMFKIDLKELDEFALPKRQQAATILMPKEDRGSRKKQASIRKAKIVESAKEAAEKPKEDGLGFLVQAMGQTKLSATAPAALPTITTIHSASELITDSSSPEHKAGMDGEITAETEGKPAVTENTLKPADNDEVSAIMSGKLALFS